MIAPDLGTHMLLTTFRKNGMGVSTPVWNIPLPDARLGMWTGVGTGKWKRIRNNPHVTMQPCNARGHVKPAAPTFSGTAEIIPPGPQSDQIRALIVARYGRAQIVVVKLISRLQGRMKRGLTFGDTIMVITVDQQTNSENTSRSSAA